MDEAMLELLRYRMDRAKEILEVAESLLAAQKYKDANNRSYYAVFYAIKAVYTTKGQDLKNTKQF